MPIRDARESDHALHLKLFPELGVDDPPTTREQWALQLMSTSFVLEHAGEDVGLAYVQLLGEDGYVRHVMVDPAHRRRGHGRELMLEAAARFRRAGCRSWRLNVKPHNTAAVALYRALGMERQHGSKALRVDWDAVERLPEDDLPRTERAALPDEDHAIEVDFGLQGGLVAVLRKNPRARLHLTLREGVRVAFGSFDPGFPGCYPFRARTPADARALLAALAQFADPAHRDLQVVLEDAPELTAAFENGGARVVMEFDHYAGALDPA